MTLRGVYTIPPGQPFLDTLAAGILDEAGGDPLALARVTVLLPTRRACRALREAFLRLGEGRPLLLPRLSPLGDLDSDALSLSLEDIPGLPEALEIPPALSPLRRQLLLARLVLRAPGMAASPDQAARLAAELARLLDQVQTEGLSFDRLGTLVPDDYAAHWQITLEFLKIVTEAWPAIRAEEGALDPAERRNRVLDAQARLWQARPPDDPVIAAGSTGSIPATARLLKVVAGLPRGAVVLPGLDRDMDEASWQALDETHPQYGLARLLETLGVGRPEVALWPVRRPGGAAPARARLLGEALRPAATTEGWRALAGLEEAALDGVIRLDCPTPQEEAGAIALMMRHALETPGRTAALVTPDRTLARRVAATLARWGIRVDDSAGRPLSDTAVGAFLRHVARCAAEAAAPVPLLALLKHPLAAGGMRPERFRARVRQLERAVLRGPRPARPGLEGLADALRRAAPELPAQAARHEALCAWFAELERRVGPWFAAFAGSGMRPLVDWLRDHVAVAEALAASDAESGAERLWRHDDGEAAAAFLNELRDAAADFPPVAGRHYPALFEALMAGRVVRPRYGLHPRLQILGLLEARLVLADLTILGGLNEGTWPPDPAADPWMSRPMRKAFGLPSPERQIGLTAHDFAQAANAPEVALTRAERVDGTPTVPSRWLLRLDTVLRALGADGRLGLARSWTDWAEALDRPERVRPSAPPAPRPPLSARPRWLSVTEIETWMRDPYAIYARHVLRLRRLDPVDAPLGAADRGQFVHRALDAFLRAHPDHLPPDPVPALIDCGRAAFGEALEQPDVWAFWWPRFRRIAEWFVAVEQARRAEARPLATEVTGTLRIDGPHGPFTLSATADRIDRRADGSLAIIDYKTGTPPKPAEVALGFAPQLPLEAAIAAAGGFPGVPAAPVGELMFWRLSGGDPAGEIKPVQGDIAALAATAQAGLESLVRIFDDPTTPYVSQPRPDRAPRYSDYAHLARVAEWSGGGGEDAE